MADPILVPNLTQGVSQQAAEHRRDSQCESQFDCINSLLDGATARPGLTFLSKAAGLDLSDAFLHPTSRNGVSYLIGVNAAAPVGINLDSGAELPFGVSSGDEVYLTPVGGVANRDAFRAQTVEDVTFLVNRTIAPEMDAASETAGPVKEAIIFVRGAAYHTKYRVKLTSGANVAEVIVWTVKADEPTFGYTVRTDVIAYHLVNGGHNTDTAEFLLRCDGVGVGGRPEFAGLNGTAGFTAVQYGSVIRVYRADGADFTVETEDSNGDDFLYAFKGFVENFSRLPKKGVTGVMLEVQGDDRTKDDNYYVKFEGNPATGTWLETVGPNVITDLDPETMPHIFTWTALDTFGYGVAAWSSRIAGDADTQPDPSFVGRKIRDLFWHEQRLGFLTEATAVWSKAQYPYTFFHDTAQILLATAPVDAKVIAGSANDGGSVVPDFAVTMSGNLFFWGQKAQFYVSSGQEPFKPDTVKVDPDTAYEYTAECSPVAVGSFLMYATGNGEWAAVQAVRFEQGRAAGELDITAHIPTYIPDGARQLTSSPTLRVLFVQTDGDTSKLYLWNFLFADNGFAQSAWNTWRLPPGGTVVWAGIRGNILKVLTQRSEGAVLLEANLTARIVDPIDGATYRTRLDLMVDETQVTSLAYNATTNRTSFVLPYTPTTPAGFRVVIAERPGSITPDTPTWERGAALPLVSRVGATVTVAGDLTGFKFYAGYLITAERTESPFHVRTEDGPLPFDRVTVGDVLLKVAKTAYSRLEVSIDSRDAKSYEFHGRDVASASLVTGGPVVADGQLRAPIGAKASDYTLRLVNDTPYPSSWQSLSYMVEGIGRKGKS